MTLAATVRSRLTPLIVVLEVTGCGGIDRAAPPAAPPSSDADQYVTTADSVRLWYRVVGQGPETVIVPAGLYHRRQFDPLARGRRLVLYDPRGRGQSDTVPPSKVSIENDFLDLEIIRRAVGVDSFALIAWSALGMEYYGYAVKFPGRVTRLVQLATVAPRREPYWNQMRANQAARIDSAATARLDARIAAGEFADREADLCRAQAALSNPATFGDPARAHLAPDVCDWPNEWPTRYAGLVRAILASFGDFDWRPTFPQVTIPRLIIHGDRDNFPVDGAREWAAGQSNARFLLLEGVGHWPHYERPEATLGAIEEFLQGRWPAASQVVSR
jgi:pimeloyl-ACP methyl ester carboxylesterase